MLPIRAAGLFFAMLPALSVWAWSGPEHVNIGSNAYNRACGIARSLYSNSTDADVASRLHVACKAVGDSAPVPSRSPMFSYSDLAGDWSMLAGDHIMSPDQLTASRLGGQVGGYRRMARSAIDNVEHFHPDSFRAWRDNHGMALELAARASTASGISLDKRFEGALAAEAFAQHYLQDSFAAGHMGFNRLTSSNAATLNYHRRMSRKGRCVANEEGEAWFTFGDGYLDERDEAAEHVINAAALSFIDFLEAFIIGRVNSSGHQKVAAKFPATFSDSMKSAADCRYAVGWPTLKAVKMPAPGVSAFEIFIASDQSLYAPAGYAVMLGLNFDVRLPIKVGFNVNPTRVFAYVGTTLRDTGPNDVWVDGGLGWQVGTSVRGFLTHELGGALTVVYSPGDNGDAANGCECEEYYSSYTDYSGRLFYGVRMEAGPVYIRLQAGAAYSYGNVGPHLSAGFGFVIR